MTKPDQKITDSAIANNTQKHSINNVAIAIFSALFLSFVVGLVSPRRAEGRCPPGYFPIGGGTGGWEGCAPMDGGVTNAPNRPSNNGITLPRLSTYDANAWRSFARSLYEGTLDDQRAKILRRHGKNAAIIFDNMRKGMWVVGESAQNQPQQGCAATFWTLNGGVALMDWKGTSPATAMMIFGRAIPSIRSAQRVRVSLTQSGMTQTVEAFHVAFPQVKGWGAFIFKVPSTQALLDSVKDVQDFQVKMQDKEIITGEWHSASTMLPDFRKCIAKKS